MRWMLLFAGMYLTGNRVEAARFAEPTVRVKVRVLGKVREHALNSNSPAWIVRKDIEELDKEVLPQIDTTYGK